MQKRKQNCNLIQMEKKAVRLLMLNPYYGYKEIRTNTETDSSLDLKLEKRPTCSQKDMYVDDSYVCSCEYSGVAGFLLILKLLVSSRPYN